MIVAKRFQFHFESTLKNPLTTPDVILGHAPRTCPLCALYTQCLCRSAVLDHFKSGPQLLVTYWGGGGLHYSKLSMKFVKVTQLQTNLLYVSLIPGGNYWNLIMHGQKQHIPHLCTSNVPTRYFNGTQYVRILNRTWLHRVPIHTLKRAISLLQTPLVL